MGESDDPRSVRRRERALNAEEWKGTERISARDEQRVPIDVCSTASAG